MSSESAKKAWATRRKNALRKLFKQKIVAAASGNLPALPTPPLLRKLKLKPKTHLKQPKTSSGQLKGIPKEGSAAAATAAALKAWETRRKDEAERLEAIRILDEMAAKRNATNSNEE